jgi:hypothetical protein
VHSVEKRNGLFFFDQLGKEVPGGCGDRERERASERARERERERASESERERERDLLLVGRLVCKCLGRGCCLLVFV